MERRKKCKQYGPVKLKIYQPPSRTFCIFKREPSSNVPDESSPLLSCLPNFTPTSRDRTDAPSLRQTDSTSVRSSRHPLHTGCLETSCISSSRRPVVRPTNFYVSRRLYVASSYDTLCNFDRNFGFLLENDISVTFNDTRKCSTRSMRTSRRITIQDKIRIQISFYPLNISLLYIDYFTRFYVLYHNTRFADFWNSELKKSPNARKHPQFGYQYLVDLELLYQKSRAVTANRYEDCTNIIYTISLSQKCLSLSARICFIWRRLYKRGT